jgi:multidrug resistance efflux pump
MSRPTTLSSPRRLPAALGLTGVLLTAAAGLTAWGLSSRADAPNGAAPPAAPTGRADPRVVCIAYCDLEYGVTPIYPLQPGRVVKVSARDGDPVEAGAPLFAVDDRAAQESLQQAEADEADAEVQLKEARTKEAQHPDRIAAQEHAVEAFKHGAAAANAAAAKARVIAEGQGPAYQNEVKAAEEQAKAIEEKQHVEEANLRALKMVDASLDVARAEQGLKAKQAQRRKAEIAVEECTVKAPTKGAVLRMLTTVGEMLGPNPRQPAVQFAPAGPRIVRAEVPQEFAGGVAEGQTATIHDDSRTGPMWRGKVTRVSDWYTHRRSMVLEPLQLNDVRTLECILTLDADQPPMRIGQRVRVTLEGAN